MSNPVVLDRRTFLGRVSITVGGVAVAAVLPVSLLQAAPARLACAVHDPCGDWTVDDMCAAYPPYSFRIDSGVPRSGRISAQVAAVDQNWVS